MFLLSCFFVSESYASTKSGNAAKIVQNDSFYFHYRILDSISLVSIYDKSLLTKKSVRYMERVSGIMAHPDGDYVGWREFTRVDLINWKKWFDSKKSE